MNTHAVQFFAHTVLLIYDCKATVSDNKYGKMEDAYEFL